MRPAAIIPGQEYAVPAAAALAEQLGLRSAGWSVAAVLTDKIRVREVTTRAGMVAPVYRQVQAAAEVRDFVDEIGSAVLKPANRQASVRWSCSTATATPLLDGGAASAPAIRASSPIARCGGATS